MSPSELHPSANLGALCTSAHCEQGQGDRVAFHWVDASFQATPYTFSELDEQSNRFAQVLTTLGLKPGDRCFTYLPKAPEQFFALLGALKAQVVVCALFSNFGDEALLDRLGDAEAKVLLTKKSLAKKIARIRPQLPALRYVLLVDADEHVSDDVLSYPALMRQAVPHFDVSPTPPETPSVLHYTSGSTGKPKGVLHLHRARQMIETTARAVLGLQPDDVYWCTADQGWVTGVSYGVLAPWLLGVTQVHYAGAYDAAAWMRLIEQMKITVWYTAPTALRMLMCEEPELFGQFDRSRLRHIFSIGEPLNPEVVHWGRRVLERDIYDTWFQTETGAIMVANRPGLELRPGSMGQPVPGIEAIVLDEETLEPQPPGQRGHLCLRAGWPSMFQTYLNRPDSYQSKFRNGYYFTGDTAYRDPEGFFWFTGRSDDVINTAGHLISPFEIESALIELDSVVESGVVGAPDELIFEKVVAFIVLKTDVTPSPELELKIRIHVSNRVSSIATPQEMVFVPALPKNKSGKILRRMLRARYLGEDVGDTSTLEET